MKNVVFTGVLFVFGALSVTSANSAERVTEKNYVATVDDQSTDVEVLEPIVVLTRNIDGTPSALLINGNYPFPTVIGVSPDRRKAVLNAYAGWQSIIGVLGGLDFDERIRVGIHASHSPNFDLYKTGQFAFTSLFGVHFALQSKKSLFQDSDIRPYLGARLNRFSQTANTFGDYSYGRLKGNQVQYLVGVSIDEGEGGVFRIEAGYSRAKTTYEGSQGENWSDFPDDYYLTGRKYDIRSPTINVSYSFYFKSKGKKRQR